VQDGFTKKDFSRCETPWSGVHSLISKYYHGDCTLQGIGAERGIMQREVWLSVPSSGFLEL
jgi:hypothetical protein